MDEKHLCVDKDGRLYREGEEPCEKKEKMIPFFVHENSMMHKDMDNERANRASLFFCITIIIITLIFVISYTYRMNTFVSVIKDMNAALIELANAKGTIAP